MSSTPTVLPVPHRAPMHRTSLHLCQADRLQLALAVCCALTGTGWGAVMSGVVLVLLAARRSARRSIGASAAVRVGGLAVPQHPDPLHAAGQHRQATARA